MFAAFLFLQKKALISQGFVRPEEDSNLRPTV